MDTVLEPVGFCVACRRCCWFDGPTLVPGLLLPLLCRCCRFRAAAVAATVPLGFWASGFAAASAAMPLMPLLCCCRAVAVAATWSHFGAWSSDFASRATAAAAVMECYC